MNYPFKNNLLCVVCVQPPGNIRGQEEWIHGWAAEERGGDEADVCPESQREGGRAERGRKGGLFCLMEDCNYSLVVIILLVIINVVKVLSTAHAIHGMY